MVNEQERTMALTYKSRLRRGRRFWDLGSRIGGTRLKVIEEPLWRQALASLELGPGEVVLDLGCGNGNGFAALREAVGPSGRVVGVDNSPRMVAAARAVVAEHGWDNVEVRLADASAAEWEDGGYDAVVAATSLSTFPDLDAALDRIRAALRDGGRLFVLDMHFGPHPAARLLRSCYRLVVGGNGDDVLAALRTRFASVEPVVGDDGRAHVPSAGRSWPPIFAALASR
jgi:ubiquinone/menaquinone biosynthesis C-methylase UbiE